MRRGDLTTAVWPRVIDLIADGTVGVQAMVTQVFPYADLSEATACADRSSADTIKVVVDCAA
jgi:threonine dehydrogenase-like Zn-dependent dehydrogenase